MAYLQSIFKAINKSTAHSGYNNDPGKKKKMKEWKEPTHDSWALANANRNPFTKQKHKHLFEGNYSNQLDETINIKDHFFSLFINI